MVSIRAAVRFTVALIMLTIAPTGAAAVSAQLSAQNIDELETVRLSIKITETRQSQTLDLSALEKDFHILNTNTVSQSRFLNGRGHSWVDYQITLQPKRTGTIPIPSIEVGAERTPTLELRVRALSDQTRQLIDDLVFFENTVSDSSIYVQSQLVLTRRLYYSQGVQLYSDLPGAPQISDAVVLTLGETRSSTTQREGRSYGVVEQRYAIFPERSGSFTIPGINITASVRLIEGDRVSRKGVRVGTEDVDVEVLPVPAQYPQDKPWLPAERVTLFDVINPERPSHDVGDTLSHELLIHVEGNIGTMAPPVELQVGEDEFRVYPQAPQIQDDTASATVKGTRVQTHSLVPLIPGPLTIPATELVWWDTVNDQVRISSTRSRTLTIEGEAVAAAPPDSQIDSQTAAPDRQDTTEVRQWPFEPGQLPRYLSVLAAILLAGGGILLVLRRVLRAGPLRFAGRGILRPNPLRIARKELQQAFANGNPALLHQRLLRYLELYFALPGHMAVQRMRQSSPASAPEMAALDALLAELYRSAGSFTDEHRQTLQHWVLNLSQVRQPHTHNALPPLYPQAF